MAGRAGREVPSVSTVTKYAAAGSVAEADSVVIRELPAHERPRERLLNEGAQALSNRELLAILLGSGAPGKSALTLADHLLRKAESLRGLARMDVEELREIKGIGLAKAAQIKAAVELARRIALEPGYLRTAIRHPGDVAKLLMDDLRNLDHEQFKLLMLDTKHRVIKIETLSVGDLSGTLVHPRELFKAVIKRSGAAVILVHNHPSGDPEPSADDIELTRRLAAGGKLAGIEVLDHSIIGDNTYVSLKQRGLLNGFWAPVRQRIVCAARERGHTRYVRHLRARHGHRPWHRQHAGLRQGQRRGRAGTVGGGHRQRNESSAGRRRRGEAYGGPHAREHRGHPAHGRRRHRGLRHHRAHAAALHLPGAPGHRADPAPCGRGGAFRRDRSGKA